MQIRQAGLCLYTVLSALLVTATAQSAYAANTIDPAAAPYNVVVGTSQTSTVQQANVAGLQNAINDAVNQGKVLALPAGTIELEFTAGVKESLSVGGDLHVVGCGQAQSILKVGPDAPAFGLTAFNVTSAATLEMEQFTLEGPDTAHSDVVGYVTYGVQATNVDGWVNLHHMSIVGEFVVGVLVAGSGEMLLELNQCLIAPHVNCASAFTSGIGIKTFRAFDCEFTLSGQYTTAYHHLLYVHHDVSLDLTRCVFSKANKYAVHIWGSPSGYGKYCRIFDCIFRDCQDGIITNKRGLTEIRNCHFREVARAIVIHNDVTISGCDIDASAGAISVYSSSSHTKALIDNTIFRGGSITIQEADSDWVFQHCSFLDDFVSAGCLDNTRVQFSDCLFNHNNSTGNSVHVMGGSEVNIDRCVFRGQRDHNLGAVTYSSSGTLHVTNSDFHVSVAGIVHYNWSTDAGSGNVTGRENYFQTPPIAKNLNPYQKLQLRSGTASTALASTAHLYPSYNHDTYHVTGTSTITNIWAGTDQYSDLCVDGKLYLIVDDAWSLSDTGNIVPLTTSPRTAGEVVLLVRDPINKQWLEQ